MSTAHSTGLLLETDTPRLRAVASQPVITGLKLATAVAAALVERVDLEAGAHLQPPGPEVALQIIGHAGRLELVVQGDGHHHGHLDEDHEAGTWTRLHVPGGALLQGGALLPTGAEAVGVRFEAVADTTVWRATTESLDAALCHLPDREQAHFKTRLAIAAALEISPDLRLIARHERQAIVAGSQLKRVRATERLVETDHPVRACYWVARGPVTLHMRGDDPVPLSLGDTVGIEALSYGIELGAYTVDAGPGAVLVKLGKAKVWRLLATAPWFANFADARRGVERNRMRIVDALDAEPSFNGVDRRQLHALLQGAREMVWRVGLSAPPLIERAGGWVVVLEGSLCRTRPQPASSKRRRPPIDVLEVVEAGDCAFLAHAGVARDSGFWRARLPARVVYISRHRCHEVLGDDAESFGSALEQRAARRVAVAVASKGPGDVALFEVLGAPGAASTEHVQQLAEGVAGRLHADFEERCLVAVVGPGSGPAPTLSKAPVQVVHVALRSSAPAADLRTWLEGLPEDVAQVLVVAGAGLEPSALRLVVDRVVLLDVAGTAGPLHDGPGIPTVYASFRPDGRLVRTHRHPPSTVRFGCALQALHAATHADRLSALGRAISGRRVGVALGGGGAWGYMHLAVLTHMSRWGIPIDMVAGVSFGSVVGAYFAALGAEAGKKQLFENKVGLIGATALGAISGTALRRFLDDRLSIDGQPRSLLEPLVPFFPACTDLVTGSVTALHTGSLGAGVRASGSLAPFFAATYRKRQVLLDGALTANVPAQVLENEGVELVVASEVIPTASVRAPRSTGSRLNLLRDLSPRLRIKYAVMGLFTLAESASEMSAGVGRVVFSSTGTRRIMPMDFASGEQVVEQAESNPAFWNTMSRLKDMWDKMAAPRR